MPASLSVVGEAKLVNCESWSLVNRVEFAIAAMASASWHLSFASPLRAKTVQANDSARFRIRDAEGAWK